MRKFQNGNVGLRNEGPVTDGGASSGITANNTPQEGGGLVCPPVNRLTPAGYPNLTNMQKTIHNKPVI